MAKIFFFNVVKIRTTLTISYTNTSEVTKVELGESDLPQKEVLLGPIKSISTLDYTQPHAPHSPYETGVVIWGQKKLIHNPDLNIIGVEIQDGEKGKS